MDSGKLSKLMERFKCVKLPDGTLATCPVRVSFASLFEPREKDDGSKEYTGCFIFPVGADLSPLMNRVIEHATNKFGAKAAERFKLPEGNPDRLIHPFKASDRLAEKYDGFVAGGRHVNAGSKFQPKMYDAALNEITSPDDIYSGVWVRAKFRVYDYDKRGKRGVSFGLVSLQKLADDDRFGSDASEGFEAVTDGPVVSSGSATKANGTTAPAPQPASDMFN
mgnify:CR=1 FL=1